MPQPCLAMYGEKMSKLKKPLPALRRFWVRRLRHFPLLRRLKGQTAVMKTSLPKKSFRGQKG